MNISTTNPFARYFKFTYGNLPNDVCSFFWGILAALLLFPIVLIGHVARPLTTRIELATTRVGAGITTVISYFLLVMFGWVVVTGDQAYFSSWGFILYPLVTVIIFGALIGFIGGVIYLTASLSERKKPGFFKNTKVWIGAIRGKYCTKITWEETKDDKSVPAGSS